MQRVITSYSQNQQLAHSPRTAFTTRLFQSEHEYSLIEEVIDGCCHIIEFIIHKNEADTNSSLHYAPIRIFSRLTSASIFLLKALALGVRKSQLAESLQVLETAIRALQTSNLDGIHLAAQYGALLKIQVVRLRRSFQSCGTPHFDSNRSAQRSSEGESSSERWQPNLELPTEHPGAYSSPITPHPYSEEHSMNSQRHYSSNNQVTDTAHIGHLDDAATAAATTSHNNWHSSIDDLFSLPFEPSMAPFTGWDCDDSFDLNPCWLDVDFIWNLPP